MYAENEPAMKRHRIFLNDLPSERCTGLTNDKVIDISKYSLTLIQAAQNQNQTNTGIFAKFCKLTIRPKVMSVINMDIQDCLTCSQAKN